MTTNWKTVRVFISSTFRDMQAERDHLVRFVFPRLREQLLPRRIHLVDIDLRWGAFRLRNWECGMRNGKRQHSRRVTATCPKALTSKRAPNTDGSSTTPKRA
ncbi:MAG: DUF4062 domain-containing protein [Deltaproteobacteria bacterium]|nr:DUF4062 domain-containing protein [Deltaproteobacteria bacterium]